MSLGWNGYHEKFLINFAGIFVPGCPPARSV